MARVTIKELQAQIAEMARQLAALEKQGGTNGAARVTAKPVQAAPAVITEDELLAISAAIGAFLGVRAHIRQIRLVSTAAWAQQGRVSIQASHRLQG
jgi:methylmalonyl-CoA carboxyltransferase large subunit